MADIVQRLRKMATVVDLAVEETVADDIRDGLIKAAEEIERLDRLAQLARANALNDALNICINAEGDIDLATWEIRMLIKEVSEGR